MSQGTFASAAMRSERNASAKKSGPLTPPCPNHPRWRRGVLPKQEARGSRRPHRCRGRARGQGRTGRTQRRSHLKAGWPVDRDKTLSRFCPAWKSKNFVSRARNPPLRSVFLSAWEAKVSWSCPARPASLGFPERSRVLPAPEIPGSVSKPNETPRKYQSGPSSWAATASGEDGDSFELVSGRGWGLSPPGSRREYGLLVVISRRYHRLGIRVDYRHAAQNSHRRENLPFWIQKKAALRRNLPSVPI